MREYSADVSLVLYKCFDLTAFAFVVGEHLREFLQVVAGNAVGEDMYRETSFGHVETRRFHAGRSISPSHVELIDAVLSILHNLTVLAGGVSPLVGRWIRMPRKLWGSRRR